MTAIPASISDPLADAIFAHYKAKYSAEPARGYLGASSIGKPCSRQLWYGLRWAKPAEFSGRLYRLFQTGHLQEPRLNADLRDIGCTVYEINPATGKQWSFSEPATGHHFRGNCDGILTGLPQAPKAPHVAEYKTSSAKLFAVLQKEGVQQAKPEHYCQVQIYMKWTQDLFGKDGCERAIYIAVNKDNDDIYTERVYFDPECANALVNKALAIITASEPPEGISTDSSWYECKFCDYHSLCFGTDVPQPTCRSCAYATAELDGDARWSCNKHKSDIPEGVQREGCAKHRYIPILLSRFAKSVDFNGDGVVYEDANGKQFVNGNECGDFSSKEIFAAENKQVFSLLAEDDFFKKVRSDYGAQVVA